MKNKCIFLIFYQFCSHLHCIPIGITKLWRNVRKNILQYTFFLIQIFAENFLNIFCSRLITCIYGGFQFNCTDLFVTVLTDEGLCCTFNGVNKKFIAKPQYKLANYNKSLCVNVVLLYLKIIAVHDESVWWKRAN